MIRMVKPEDGPKYHFRHKVGDLVQYRSSSHYPYAYRRILDIGWDLSCGTHVYLVRGDISPANIWVQCYRLRSLVAKYFVERTRMREGRQQRDIS